MQKNTEKATEKLVCDCHKTCSKNVQYDVYLPDAENSTTDRSISDDILNMLHNEHLPS